MQRLSGVGGSPGVAKGTAVVLRPAAGELRYRLSADAIAAEVGRIERARELSRAQLQAVKARVEQISGPEHGYLFDAQLLMLDDPLLVPRAVELVRQSALNAEWALRRAFDELATLLLEGDDPYVRERRGDIADLVGRLSSNLRGGPRMDPVALLDRLDGPTVLVADEIAPSVAAQLDWDRLAGIVMDRGSRMHHTAILARSLGVPAVVGLREGTVRISPGAFVLMDGTSGEVTVDPSSEALAEAERVGARRAALSRSLGELRALPPLTRDRVRITVQANIDRPDELSRAREFGADGIGLYRSDLLLAGPAPPSEDEQYEIYRHMVEQMAPSPVTVRTLDLSVRHSPGSGLGAVGVPRAGRSVDPPKLLAAQLRALLRAGRHGRLRLMFPLVGGPGELAAFVQVLAEAREALGREDAPPATVAVGLMIEVPAAALTADLLAPHVDFFSIGTNDLIHYTLAIDRGDASVSHLYDPCHPAVLRLLRQVRRAARRYNRPLSLCGEMASDPGLLPLLVGLGLRQFSMTPAAIPLAKHVLRSLDVSEARRVAAQCLAAPSAREVERMLTKFLAGTAEEPRAVSS